VVTSLLLACAPPDPDALLRRGDLAGAAAAWRARSGHDADVDHPVADILARRAATDPEITMASVLAEVAAARLLELAPRLGNRALDVGEIASLAALLGGCRPSGAWLVSVGRSEVPADRDPLAGGALPFAQGRIVGHAADVTAARALGARLDADPPARRTLVASQDRRGQAILSLEHRDGAWWGVSSPDPESAVGWMRSCGG
jgi:hypothetical protein